MDKLLKSKISNKIVILLTIFIILLSSIKADTLSDYQKQIDDLKNEQKQNAEKLTGIEKEIEQYMYDITELDSKINEYSAQLDSLQKKVDEVNTKIEEYEDMLQNSSQRYSAAEEMYTTRLRAIYENGMPSIIDLFFESEGISDFFSKMSVYQGILEYDKSLIGNVKNEKEYISNIKKDIEVQKLQLDQLKYDVEKSTTALKNASDSKAQKVKQMEESKSNLEQKQKILGEKEKEAVRKRDEELARLASEGSSFDGNFNGQFTWPVPGIYKITAAFDDKEYYNTVGMRHTGTDIGASVGNSVVAMESGKVVTCTYNAGGYGWYIVIDHGLGSDGYKYLTLYGHLSTILVKKGDVVTRGQQIAKSGNSGFSTGPHLHFEIDKTKNGKMWSIDPMSYFAGSGAPFTFLTYGKYISYPFTNIGNYQYSSQIQRNFSF